jgi:hypothetical protein
MNGVTVNKIFVAAGLMMALTALPASAAPITGVLGIAGGVTYNQVGPGSEAIIDFQPSGAGLGVAVHVGAATEYFTGITVGSDVGIQDLTNSPGLVGGGGILPSYAVVGDSDVPFFLFFFEDRPNLRFDMTEIVAQGGFPACNGTQGLGDTCVTENAFVLTETSEGLRIAFDVRGWFRTTGNVDEGFYKGAFSTTFTGLTFDSAFQKLALNQDLNCEGADCTFDATFTPVPEPATLLTFGTGTALLAARRRRAAKKASKRSV